MASGQSGGGKGPVRVVQVADEATTLAPITDYVDDPARPLEVVARPGPAGVLDAVDATVDCVLTEYRLASTDGVEVVAAVREDHPDLPVILLTERRDDDVVRDALAAGATAHLQTDVLAETPRKFRNRLLSAVDRYRRDRRSAARGEIVNLVGRIDRRLIHAKCRDEVEAAVCQEISRTDPYRFAWIGTAAGDDGEIRPRVSDGFGDGYLEDVTVLTDGSDRGRGPAGRALETGEIVLSHDVRADGTFDPWTEQALDRGFESVAALPLAYGGTGYGVLALYADRTHPFDERERAMLEQLRTNVSRAIHETALRTELWEYRQMVERAGNAMFLADEQGTFTYVNPAFEGLLDCEGSAVADRKVWDLDVGVDAEDGHGQLARSVREGAYWEGELQLATDADHDRTVDLSVAPVGGRERERYVGVGTDITEQKTLQTRLETQRNELELLNRILRHDVRNDVQVLLALADFLESHVDEEGAEYVERLVEKSRHIAELTRSAGDLSGTITDADGDPTERVDLDAVLAEEVADLRQSFDVDVTRDGLPAEPAVRADELLHSVFRNLLHNAVQHSDAADVAVDVTTEVGDETVTVRIADDGPGIPDARKDGLFGYEERGADSSGTGIGLFLVDVLVDRYGGAVRVEDNHPDGTVFAVELPRADR